MPRAQDAQERPRKGINQLLAAAGWQAGANTARPEFVEVHKNVGRGNRSEPASAAAEAAATIKTPSPSQGEGRDGGHLLQAAEPSTDYRARGATFLARLQHMSALKTEGLWPARIKAIHSLRVAQDA